MIKGILGIRELELNIKKLRQFFDVHWGHTNYIHNEMNRHSKKFTEYSKRLENMEWKLEERTKSIIVLMESILQRLEDMNEPVSEVLSAPIEQTIIVHKKEFGNKDKIILQIMHQNAAFSPENSIETTDIFANLPFSITPRGLRKKLASLEKAGLVSSRKHGKKNKWFVRTGKLAEVSEIISEQKKKKRNRN